MGGSMLPAEIFCKLKDPERYVVCSWDLRADHESRRHWVAFMKRNIRTTLRLGIDVALVRGDLSAPDRAENCDQAAQAMFDRLMDRPETFDELTMMTLDVQRDRLLRQHGFDDPFIDLKDRSNHHAVASLGGVCQALDAMSPGESFRAAIEGVFAGNIFDMGAEATARAFLDKSPDFSTVRNRLAPRPWLEDGFDALAERALSPTGGYRKVLIFLDNAGSDFVLGIVPLARWFARHGAQVVLAANDLATLNDMTFHDITRWWPILLQAEPSLSTMAISVVNTGAGEPLIDLGRVSPGLNTASRGVDLVILEGMGRGIESNREVVLSCDVANLAMIKDLAVARLCGGELYDIFCRFHPAS